MSRFFSSIFVSLAIVALSIVGFQPSPVGAAANAALTYSGGTSLKVGESVTVTVNVAISEFSASSIRVVSKYDPSFFENVSVSDSGSAFNSSLSTSIDGNTGTITSSRFKQGEGVTGTVKVLDITLKAKKEGNTSLSFTSNSKIWESNTGLEKPLATNATHGLTIGSNVTNTPSPAPTATATPTPTPTQNPTSKPTARVTAKPTAKPTSSTNATPAPSTGSVSAEQSTVSFSKLSASADGIDAITVTVTLRDANASVITSVEPSLSGLRDGSDTALPFTLDSTGLNWETNITSVVVGTVTASVAASGTTLATQDLTFTEPIATSSPTTDSSAGSSFGRLLLIGGLILLLLLLLLYFLWKKLRGDDEDDDSVDPNAPAFPGDTSGPAANTDVPSSAPDASATVPPVVVAAAEDKKEEPAPAPADTSNANFSAAAALQRAEEPKQDTQPPEQSINL